MQDIDRENTLSFMILMIRATGLVLDIALARHRMAAALWS